MIDETLDRIRFMFSKVIRSFAVMTSNIISIPTIESITNPLAIPSHPPSSLLQPPQNNPHTHLAIASVPKETLHSSFACHMVLASPRSNFLARRNRSRVASSNLWCNAQGLESQQSRAVGELKGRPSSISTDQQRRGETRLTDYTQAQD